MTIRVQENVTGLDVTMNDILVMEVLKSLAGLYPIESASFFNIMLSTLIVHSYLKTDRRNLVLLQRVVINDIDEGSSLHILHHSPKLRVSQVPSRKHPRS
jgi:hypothetical protein